jgi:hypothetical protein
MVHMKQALVGLGVGVLLVAALTIGGAATALADSASATTTITGGTLTEATSSAPTISATLNGTDQTPTYTMAIDTNDATGSGAGWNLTITSTQFTTGGTTPKTLSTSASSVTSAVAVCKQGTCTNPTNSITYPFTIPAGSTPPTAVKLFNAAVNTGMGDFTVTPTVSVAIPANSYAGTYTSTITLAVISAP